MSVIESGNSRSGRAVRVRLCYNGRWPWSTTWMCGGTLPAGCPRGAV